MIDIEKFMNETTGWALEALGQGTAFRTIIREVIRQTLLWKYEYDKESTK